MHGVACIERLVRILDGPDASAAVEAARELLSRGYGQALQSLAFGTRGIAIEVNAGGEELHRPNGESAGTWNAG